MAKYNYCSGVERDANFMEQECERRDDCQYYHIDNMRKYWTNPDFEMFYPPRGKRCPYFIPREKKEKKEKYISPFD